MRPLSRRLANLGHPLAATGDTVSIYRTRWVGDVEANPVKVPYGDPVVYPAIVTRSQATMTDQSGTEQSTTAYRVMILAAADPGVTTETVMTWTVPLPGGPGAGPPASHDLVAAGEAINAGPGAWACDAMEVTPDPEGGDEPANHQDV